MTTLGKIAVNVRQWSPHKLTPLFLDRKTRAVLSRFQCHPKGHLPHSCPAVFEADSAPQTEAAQRALHFIAQ